MAVVEAPYRLREDRDLPRRSTLAGLAAVYEHMWLVYRRTWRGSIFGSFVQPALFLLAMGVGLGSYVDKASPGTLGGVPYLQWLAPALLVSTVMQGSVFEATFPVLGGFNWDKRYHAMHAAPLTPFAIAFGQLGWVVTRALIVASIFCFEILLFGAAATPGIVLTIPVAMLTALAFAGPVAAFMSTQRDTTAFNSIWRFGVTPLFLFSGTFFPTSRLPDWLEPVSWFSPLWHAVELCRAATTGSSPSFGTVAGHVAFLVAALAAGSWWGVRRFTRALTA
jgi:lipooligosaccharide transport system permease protein